MIQVIRFHTRQFHVTSKTLLRRIVHRNSGGNEEHKNFKNSIDVASAVQVSNFDYLGIESDEGAITVRDQKHSSLQDSKPPGRIKERFHKTMYGVVRYDAENKPKFHGQYENQLDFTFPYHSSENVEVNSNIKNSSGGQVHQKIVSFNDVEPNFIHCETHGDNSTHVSINEASEDLNYVDEYYFAGSKIDNCSNDNRSEKSTSDELNFIDEYYFGNENVVELSTPAEQVLKNGIHATKFNFDSKEGLSSSNNYAINDSDNNNNAADKVTSDKMNFIDSNYFGNVSASKHLPVKEETFSESSASEQDFRKKDPQESVSWCTTNNISEIDYNKGLNDDFNFSGSSKPNDSLMDTSVNSHLSESAMQNQVPLDNHVQNNEKSVTELRDSLQLEVNKHERKSTSLQKPLSNEKKHKLKSVKSMIQAELESDSDSKRLFFKKNDFKYSSSTSEESNEMKQISTAHDFVAKLWKEQEVSKQSHQKAVTGTSTEKVDSKGFRILKNQVQVLSHFTRREVLDLLKKNIVYSDDDLIVLNKPYGLVIHESETTKEPCLSMFLDDLAKEMDIKATNPKLLTVHRLDKETTGCLLLARNETMAQNLKSLFAQRKIVKKYWIITIRVPDPVKGIIDIPISEGSIENRIRMVLHPKLPKDIPYKSHSRNGRPAVTSYEVISESGNAALVEVIPVTGVKHQIRVHFGLGLSCPILGDHKYSFLDKLVPQKLPADILQRLHVRQSKVRHIPMHIHAKNVMIPNYFQGRNLFINIPLPSHMIANMKRLKFKK